jgi:hypothetical protein
MMTEQEFEEQLVVALAHEASVFEDEGNAVEQVTTFREAGILTSNRGLVVRMDDGSEFQVTVVRAR